MYIPNNYSNMSCGCSNPAGMVKNIHINGQSAAKRPSRMKVQRLNRKVCLDSAYSYICELKFNKMANKKTIKEYRIWKSMKARCQAPSAKKGVYQTINVCNRWKQSYENFIADMGPIPSDKHSLDRIDNTKGYSPDNCRWATQTEQTKNRGSFNKVFTYMDGRAQVLKDWAKELGIKYTTLYQRLYRQNMSFESAVAYTRLTTYNGESDTLKNIVAKYGIVSYELVVDRLRKKWSLEQALTTPKQTRYSPAKNESF